MRGMASYQVQRSFTAWAQKLWPFTINTMGVTKQFGHVCRTSPPSHCFRNGREIVMVDVCYQFTGFQNKHVFKIFGNIFAHFPVHDIFTPDTYLSFKFHHLGSERWRYLKRSPSSYKTTSFLFSSDVYLGRAERPSFWLFDSCESQDDRSLLWVAEPYLDSNWVYFAGSGQMFFVLLTRFCVVHQIDVCSVCQQIEKINKNKFRPGQEQHYCVFFVLGQWRWSHQP